MLEGELQAREVSIAVLKSEQIKRLLNPPKLPSAKSGFKAAKNLDSCVPSSKMQELHSEQTIKYSADPLSALSRDSFAVYEPSFDYSTTLALFNLKIYHLEHFINNQKLTRNTLCEQLKAAEERYDKILNALEDERLKSEKLKSKFQDSDRIKLVEEIKTLTLSIEESKSREKQIILSLLNERKHLIVKLIDERHQNEELRQVLTSEKGKIAEMVEGLEDESKRSLQMEAELEKYLNDFEKERNNFKVQIQVSELKNAELQKELDQLRSTMDDGVQKMVPVPSTCSKSTESADTSKWNIGEGVRSSIVTMPVSTKVHSLSSVSAVAHPKASVAQPVTKSIPSTNTILPPPSIPVPQPKQSNTATMKKVVPTVGVNNAIAGPTVDSAHVISSSSSKTPNDSINPADNVEPVVKSPDGSKNDTLVKVKQSIMFYENSANQSKPAAPTVPSTTTKKTSVGGRVPPPVPPNKPTIKPVLPSQAILQQTKIKDANNLLNKSNSQTKCPNSSNAFSNASAGISKS